MMQRAAGAAPASAGPTLASIVVGVGASAGGLEAMQGFFGHLRANGRVGYVVAQHMARGAQADLLVRALQRVAELPVRLACHGTGLEADLIYVIPPDRDGAVIDGALHLLPRDLRRLSTPCVDVLLQSLADSLGSHGWAVILSGAGVDGMLGCAAVQGAGGRVVVQDPSEARFTGMLDAVIESGAASVTLRARQIGAWIGQAAFGKEPAYDEAPVPLAEPAPVENLLAVIDRVREVTGIDFSGYREETLWRRLISRRNALGLEAPAYTQLLMRDAQEVQHLQTLFLVSLSSFWRDRESFVTLGGVLALRLAAKPPGEPVRAWVAGCASGEEAYTLATMLMAEVERQGVVRSVQVIATDLNRKALALADTGEYSHKAFREAPHGWTEQWFDPVTEGWRIRPQVASCVRFEYADVESGFPGGLGDGTLDLVSCRNLLIYFTHHKQDRVIARFRLALRPDGLLFIGPSERLSPAAQTGFRTLNAEHRIFARRPVA